VEADVADIILSVRPYAQVNTWLSAVECVLAEDEPRRPLTAHTMRTSNVRR
jgi:hypothetical protein